MVYNGPYSNYYPPSVGKWIDISDQVVLSNITVGTGGTLSCKITKAGQTVTGYISITLGTGFTIGTNPSFSKGFTLDNPREASAWIGSAFDASTNQTFMLNGFGISNTQIGFRHSHVSGQKIEMLAISATDPITFASGDVITLSGTFKEADST